MYEYVSRDGEVRLCHPGCREDDGWTDLLGVYGRQMAQRRDGLIFCDACSYRLDAEVTGTMLDAFDVIPNQAGLRGDRYLWRAMREHLAFVSTPDLKNEVEALLYATFQGLSDYDLHREPKDEVFASQYAHGGMSSGHLFLPWWRNEAIPLMILRASRIDEPKFPYDV